MLRTIINKLIIDYTGTYDGLRYSPGSSIPKAIAYCTECSANCVKNKDGILSIKEISRNEMIKFMKDFPDNEIPLNVILIASHESASGV